jgi:hypothetical protein
MPETWKGLEFSTDGVCSQCTTYDARKAIHWGNRRDLFIDSVVDPAKAYAEKRGLPYDCIVGFSGGKDSSWVLYSAVKTYGLKPLAVTFDHGFRLDEASAYNLREIPKKLNVDHISMTIGDATRNCMVRKGLTYAKDFCVHCHRGVGAFSAQVAAFYGTPLVLWGEPAYVDLKETASGAEHFKKWFDSGLGVLEGRDYSALNYPENDAKKLGIWDVYLGNFEWWDQWEHADILEEELGWKRVRRFDVPEICSWDKVDCVMEPIRGWQGFIKAGVGRACFNLSKAIRAGKIGRDEALLIMQQLDGVEPTELLKEFEDETGITKSGLAGYLHVMDQG